MPPVPMTIAIEDLPCLESEAALFNAAIDQTNMDPSGHAVIISLITNP